VTGTFAGAGGCGVGSEMRGAYSSSAVAGWRLEYLRRRAGRDQRDGEGVLRAQARGARAHAALYARGAGGGAEAGRHPADEYLQQALPRAARTISLGASAHGAAGDDPVSAVAIFQYPRALVMDARDADAAGDYQSLPAHARGAA